MTWHEPKPCTHCGQDIVLTLTCGWINPQAVDPVRCPDSPTTNKIHEGQ